MQRGIIVITQKEATRYDVLRRVLDGTISLTDAAMYMGVSYRQAKRLKKKAEEGLFALAHGNRGRRPPNRLPDNLHNRILSLSHEKYALFNDTHFTEQLASEGIRVSRETIRRIRREAGIVPKRKRKVKKHHKRRPRKTSEGVMMLWDGSPHRWFGPQEPACCLMAGIDDATGKILGLLFCEHECSWAYLTLLKQVVTRWGVPASVYQDKHGTLKRNDDWWSLEEELAGERDPTQVGMALRDLGIEPIFANSPQAKGRVEKLFETLQDRLVAQMALLGIKDIASANSYLEDMYISQYNERFSVTAAEEHKWRRLHNSVDLDRICAFRYKAKVGNDNAVRFCGKIFDIEPGPKGRSYAGIQADLRQMLDGSWRIYHKDKLIQTAPSTEIGEPIRAKKRRRDAKAAWDCHWVYIASRQPQAVDPGSPMSAIGSGIARQKGKPIGATRLA
ncbi:MAG: ISNCY family transposase [Armatimonadota bacterium]